MNLRPGRATRTPLHRDLDSIDPIAVPWIVFQLHWAQDARQEQ